MKDGLDLGRVSGIGEGSWRGRSTAPGKGQWRESSGAGCVRSGKLV